MIQSKIDPGQDHLSKSEVKKPLRGEVSRTSSSFLQLSSWCCANGQPCLLNWSSSTAGRGEASYMQIMKAIPKPLWLTHLFFIFPYDPRSFFRGGSSSSLCLSIPCRALASLITEVIECCLVFYLTLHQLLFEKLFQVLTLFFLLMSSAASPPESDICGCSSGVQPSLTVGRYKMSQKALVLICLFLVSLWASWSFCLRGSFSCLTSLHHLSSELWWLREAFVFCQSSVLRRCWRESSLFWRCSLAPTYWFLRWQPEVTASSYFVFKTASWSAFTGGLPWLIFCSLNSNPLFLFSLKMSFFWSLSLSPPEAGSHTSSSDLSGACLLSPVYNFSATSLHSPWLC